MTTSHAAVELFSTSILSNHKVRSRHERYTSILAVKKIPYIYHDLASDEEAKSRWRRKARDPQIPGLLVHNEWRGTFEEFEESIEFGELDLFLKVDPVRSQQEEQLNENATRSAGSSTTPSETISSGSGSYVSASSSKAPNRSVSHPVKSIARLAQPKAPSQTNLAPALPFAPAGSGRRKDHDAETFLSSLGISDLNLTEEELNEILESGKSSTSTERPTLDKEVVGSDTTRKYPSSLGIGSSKPPVQRTYIPSAEAGVKPLQFAKMGNGSQRSATSFTSPLRITPSARYNDSHLSSRALAAEAQASISSRSFSSLKLKNAVSRGDKLEDAFKSTKAASSNGHKEHIVGREDLDELMSSLGLDDVEMTEEEAEAFLLDGSIPSGLDTHGAGSKLPSIGGKAVVEAINADKLNMATSVGEDTADGHSTSAENGSEAIEASEKNNGTSLDAEEKGHDKQNILSAVESIDDGVIPTAKEKASAPTADTNQEHTSDLIAKDDVLAQNEIAKENVEDTNVVSLNNTATSASMDEAETPSTKDTDKAHAESATDAAALTSSLISDGKQLEDGKGVSQKLDEEIVAKGGQEDFVALAPTTEAVKTSIEAELDTRDPDTSARSMRKIDIGEAEEVVNEPLDSSEIAQTTRNPMDSQKEDSMNDTSVVEPPAIDDIALKETTEDVVNAETPSRRPVPLQIEEDASNFSIMDNLDLLNTQSAEKEQLGLIPGLQRQEADDLSTAKLEPAFVLEDATKAMGSDPQDIPLPISAKSSSSPTTIDVPAVEFASPTTIPSSPSVAAALSSSPQNPANLSPVTARRRQSTSASRSSSRRAMDIPRRGSHNSMASEGSSSSPHLGASPSFLTSPVMSTKSSDDRKSPKNAAKKFFNKMKRSSSNSKRNEDEEEEEEENNAISHNSSYSYDPNQKRISAILREADAAMEGMGDEDLDLSHDSIQSDHAFNLEADDKVINWTASTPIAQDQ